MELIDTDRAVAPLRRPRHGRRDERRVGGQHDVRRRQPRRPGRLHRQGRPTTSSARCSATTSTPSAWRSGRGGTDDDTPTGRCIIVVTPDAQRTMNTYLGVSSLLVVDDLDEAAIADGAVLYMEGYLFDRDDAKKAFRRAAGVAHAAGRKVSLTLSDSFCVDRHRDDFRALVRDEVDILFGNDDELCSLYELDSLDDAIARRARRVRRWPPSRAARRARHRRRRRRRGRRCRPSRSSGCSTPPAPATSTPPASLRLHRGRGRSPSAAGSARSPPPRSSATSVPGPLVELRTLVRDGCAVTRSTRLDVAERWLAAEPDADIAVELAELIERCSTGADGRRAGGRFAGQLQFGTAGLRAAVGAGPLRMNRLVVRQAAAGLGEYLLDASRPARSRRGAARRRRSATTPAARATCSPSTRRGWWRRRASGAMLLPGSLPTPVLAWAITELDARGRRDGHGVAQPAGRQRLQGVPRRRAPRSSTRTTPDRRAHRPVRSDGRRRWPTTDDPLITRLDTSFVDALRRRDAGRAAAPRGDRRRRRLHADARRRRRGARGRSTPPGFARRSSSPSSSSPTGRSRPWRSRTRRSRGRWTCCSTLAARCGAARARQRPRRRPARRGHPAARRVVAAARRRRDRLAVRRPHPRQHDAATTGSSSRRSCRRRCSARMAGPTRRPLRRDVHRVQVDRQDRRSNGPSCASCSATSRRSATSWRTVRSTRTASPRRC